VTSLRPPSRFPPPPSGNPWESHLSTLSPCPRTRRSYPGPISQRVPPPSTSGALRVYPQDILPSRTPRSFKLSLQPGGNRTLTVYCPLLFCKPPIFFLFLLNPFYSGTNESPASRGPFSSPQTFFLRAPFGNEMETTLGDLVVVGFSPALLFWQTGRFFVAMKNRDDPGALFGQLFFPPPTHSPLYVGSPISTVHGTGRGPLTVLPIRDNLQGGPRAKKNYSISRTKSRLFLTPLLAFFSCFSATRLANVSPPIITEKTFPFARGLRISPLRSSSAVFSLLLPFLRAP